MSVRRFVHSVQLPKVFTIQSLTVALFMTGMALFLGISSAAAITIGEKPPEIALPDQAQKLIGLDNFKGKIVYVDFWASWCPSCRRSLPFMNTLQEKYGKDKLEIIAINLDQDKEDAVRLLEKINSKITILFDSEGETARIYKVKAMPTSILIDQDGKIVSVFEGFQEETEERIGQELQKLISSI